MQVFPSKINGAIDTAYWLPSYFTQWYGASLVLPDGRAAELDESGALAKPDTYADAHIPAKPPQTRASLRTGAVRRTASSSTATSTSSACGWAI